MKRLRAVSFLGLLLLLMSACSPAPQFNATDLTGADYGADFALTDHNGKPRHLADFKGQAVVMFFGYTQCPDVCPSNMGVLADVMKQLGTDASRVQVLFVTIDPERDTRDLLAQYVPAFHPSFLGLSGDAAATMTVAKSFKAFYQKQAGTTTESYTMDHSAGSYVFDPSSRLRLYIRHGAGAQSIAQDIKALLNGK